ncbi:MAG: tyrosine-type recombinase/integrase [Burkholderiales bacterium]|nr:tyrosine-type recombinase/integrase [Anaerolineae bacterium]
MPRAKMPALSPQAEGIMARFGQYLAEEQDLNIKTIRSYLSDLRQFCAWYETVWNDETTEGFAPSQIATPTITRYRAFVQIEIKLKPASINRHLVSIKRFFEWALDQSLIERDPSRVVKLVPEVEQPPRHLSDKEEAALVAAVENFGTVRDQTIIILLLHTGLRAMELCNLKPDDIKISKRSGILRVISGKRNKHREVPLNATARAALDTYLPALEAETEYLFPSKKTHGRLSERALRYIVAKYAHFARIEDISPHDLRHRFGYRMAESTPLHRLAHIMGHDSLDTTMTYVRATQRDLQSEVEKIAWE